MAGVMLVLSNRLNELIQLLGIKKCEFAKRIHFSQAYISMLLNGNKTNPSIRFCDAVKNAFRVNPEWLKYGTGDMFLSDTTDLTTFEQELIDKYHSLPLTERKLVEEVIDAFLYKHQYSAMNVMK